MEDGTGETSPEKLEESPTRVQEDAETSKGEEAPKDVAEAPREASQEAGIAPEEVGLQRTDGQGPMETTEDEEPPAQVPQKDLPMETATAPGPLEASKDTAAQEEEEWILAQGQKLSQDVLYKTGRKKEGLTRSEETVLTMKVRANKEKRLSLQQTFAAGREGGQKSGSEDEAEQEGRIGKSSLGQTLQNGKMQEAETAADGVTGHPVTQEMVASGERQADSPAVQAASPITRDSEGGSIQRGGSAIKADTELKLLGDGALEVSSEEERSGRESREKEIQDEGAPTETQTTVSGMTPVEEESVVTSALPGMVFENKSQLFTMHPLSLSWVFGYNSKLPVFNLLDEEYRMILYVSSHTAVIHDVLRNQQFHLQGHSSCISCICLSDDRRWIATADQGPESLVIVWDSYSAVPVHTIFDSHPEGGVGAIAISHDSKFLATIGAGEVQKVCIWRWTTLETGPVCSVELQTQFEFQDHITFNSGDHRELVSNSKTQVIFYAWEDNVLLYHAPFLTEKTFNKAVGIFSQSLFHFSKAQAITGTMEGKLVIWDAVCPPTKSPNKCVKPYNMKAIKLVHLQKDGITVLAAVDRNFVTCDVRGHIKFYDGDLQLLHWYSQLKLGPIRSISFSKQPACPVDVSKFSTSCTLSGQPFIVRNFIVSTSDALTVHIRTEGLKVTKCLEEPNDAVHALTCHPSKPLMAKGSCCGLLKVWNYKLNQYLVSRIFKGESIRSLCYNHDGSLLAAGFAGGSVDILDSISLEDECPEPFQDSRGAVIHMNFSHNSQYFATADENMSVNLYAKMIVNKESTWHRLAALRSHYKPICTLLFGVHLDSDEPRLLSLGEDRFLVEYDLKKSGRGKLAILRRERIEQNAVPMCITWYPPLTTEYFFLTANSHYKMKLYNVTTWLCRKTVLGPTYGSPLQKILILPTAEDNDPQKQHLAYITKDKVGLQILPVDGNPHKSSTFICHPAGISNLVSSYDACHLFTAGGSDCTVMKWDVNLTALEGASQLGGEDLIPFYRLLDGGREGELFRELEDYFYYAQLCHQGINTMEPRKVSTHIPLEQVPLVMRAIGFYPTEGQIEDMLNEVKFSEYLETGKQVTHINLGDFIKLYINHRPAFGLPVKEIQNAFQVLGLEKKIGERTINRDDLLFLLQRRGEHFTEEELAECLTTLLGVNPEGGRIEVGSYNAAGADVFIEEGIPEEITAAHFTADLLGLPVPEPPPPKEAETCNELTSSVPSLNIS
ncbi:cilia- and flagella-associated protein 251 [Tiliqua scincoides]|uniref:cilia- and flagella-associated protein 251 n=1 Tax=Tiliqua scincoides TaxID=71010 RepID=UPI0034618E09